MKTDPILLEILVQRFRSVAEEMGHALQRTGYTAFVSETADLGVALISPEGEIFGYPSAIGISMFANLQFAEVLAAFDDYAPGDMVIYNDPYTSGGTASHLPDVNVFAPVFDGDRLLCFTYCYVHSTDMGGNVPGSLSPRNHEIFQEGLRIPPLRLYRRGERNEEAFRLLMSNVRVPKDNAGDLRAMITALRVGEARVHELVARYGAPALRDAMVDVLDYSERRARLLIETIPDGVYRFSDYLDNDVASEIPVKLCVAITVAGSGIHLDFSGTDLQLRSAFNIFSRGRPHPWLVYKVMFLLLTIEGDIPVNAGLMRPITVDVPQGSVLNCEFPAALGLRTTTGVRVQDAIFGALAQALPDIIPAAGAGTVAPIVFAERAADGELKVNVLEPMSGGTGGHSGADGLHARDVVDIANLRNSPLESIEAKASVRMRRYALRIDSGGPGRSRGGCGASLEFEVLTEDCMVTARGLERHRFQPWGLLGGDCGASGMAYLRRVDDVEFMPIEKVDTLRLGTGDRVLVELPGGGGYGDPFERDPAKVLDDVRNGFVSMVAARRDYGVAIVDERIDESTTLQLRGMQRPARIGLHTLGTARIEYERVWNDEVWGEFVGVLYGLPRAERSGARAALWAAVEAMRHSAPTFTRQTVKDCWQQLSSKRAAALRPVVGIGVAA